MTKTAETKAEAPPEPIKTPPEGVKEGWEAGEKAGAEPPTETVIKPLDTLDQAAKNFVASGISAREVVGAQVRTSGEKLEAKERDQEVTDKLAQANFESMSEQSAHNTAYPASPVYTENLDRPDYNPQRRPSSKANQLADTGEDRGAMAYRIDEKKELPTNAELTQARRNEHEKATGDQLNAYASPYKGEQ